MNTLTSEQVKYLASLVAFNQGENDPLYILLMRVWNDLAIRAEIPLSFKHVG